MSLPVEILPGWLDEGVKGFLIGKGEFVSLMHLDCTDCGIIDARTGEIPLSGKCTNRLRLRLPLGRDADHARNQGGAAG